MQHTAVFVMKEISGDTKNPKSREHCHIYGNYRGAAHSKCYLKLI